MREHLFTAKDMRNNWVNGGYFKHNNRMLCPIGDYFKKSDFTHYIFSSGFADWNMFRPIERFEVQPETVSEYTGRNAENGYIFENHIIGFIGCDSLTEEYEYMEGVVTFIKDSWKVILAGVDEDCPDETRFKSLESACAYRKVRIVGNKFDNPERLSSDFWDENTLVLLQKWGIL